MLGPERGRQVHVLARARRAAAPGRGQAVLDGPVLFDSRRPPRTWVPPHERGVALLAQDPLLFPHLSVLDNVAFGPRSRGPVAARRAGRARRLAGRGRRRRARRPATRPSSPAGRPSGSRRPGPGRRPRAAAARRADGRPRRRGRTAAAPDAAAGPRRPRRRHRHPRRPRRAAARRPGHRRWTAAGSSRQGPTDEVLTGSRGAVRRAHRRAEPARRHRDRRRPRDRGRNPHRRVERRSARPQQGDRAVAVFRPNAVSVFRHPPGGSPRNALEVTVTHLEPLGGDRVRVHAAVPGATPARRRHRRHRRRPRPLPRQRGLLHGQSHGGHHLPRLTLVPPCVRPRHWRPATVRR